MTPPSIESSTKAERLKYVEHEWRCLSSCEMCGKCRILRGKLATTVYREYIEGRESYRDATIRLRDNNY